MANDQRPSLYLRPLGGAPRKIRVRRVEPVTEHWVDKIYRLRRERLEREQEERYEREQEEVKDAA